ncbi:unnamed protein product [Schistosoma mattheei]|nr:unnamed protein product [Schistosoma mattheei]
MYSYGSGMASAMYSILIHPDRDLSTILNCSLESSNGLSNIHKRLFDERTQVTVSQFELMLKERELSHNSAPFEPTFRPEGLFPGSYYLKNVDGRYRRFYEKLSEC